MSDFRQSRITRVSGSTLDAMMKLVDTATRLELEIADLRRLVCLGAYAHGEVSDARIYCRQLLKDIQNLAGELAYDEARRETNEKIKAQSLKAVP